jgi:hypothetical protein
MAPLALVMMLSLLVVCWLAFPDTKLQYHSGTPGPEASSGLELSGPLYRLPDGAGVETGTGWGVTGGLRILFSQDACW